MPFKVVPGISAALAAANSCNIPITERKKSNAVLICTAHTADYSFDQLKGIAELLKAGNSLALYMGLKSLDKLIPKLIEVTGNPDIPINAISNVSRENEVLLSSTLGKNRISYTRKPITNASGVFNWSRTNSIDYEERNFIVRTRKQNQNGY